MHENQSVDVCSLGDGSGTTRPFNDGEPDVVRLQLAAGESVEPHTHPGRHVLFTVLDGEFDVTVGETAHRLTTHDCLRFDGEREVAPAATDEGDASALVVLAKQ